MHVLEITTPGAWLDYEDREWVRGVGRVLIALKDQFFTANAALNLYEQSQAAVASGPDVFMERYAEEPARKVLRKQVIAELQLPAGATPNMQLVGREVDRRLRRQKWDQGVVPFDFRLKQVTIHAHAFIFAIDMFEKLLGVLAKIEAVPQEVARQHAQLLDHFPDLRGVRNTLHHVEDRVRGLGAGAKPMSAQPVDLPGLSIPDGGIVSINVLLNDGFGSTMSDGRFGQVAITPTSLVILANVLHSTLQAFRWIGPETDQPLV